MAFSWLFNWRRKYSASSAESSRAASSTRWLNNSGVISSLIQVQPIRFGEYIPHSRHWQAALHALQQKNLFVAVKYNLILMVSSGAEHGYVRQLRNPIHADAS